jgi:hypothetical protein
MIKWWTNKKTADKQNDDLQLISIHIPKTAGTSFRNTLKAVYGDKAVIRLDIELDKPVLKINEKQYHSPQLPKGVKAIHGHFNLPLLKKHFQWEENKVPVITWLRHPVERVVSNYYYLAKILKQELQEDKKGINILPKMQRTLLEYAADELNQNRMTKHLAGIDLKDFFYIGFVENYEEDLHQLGHMLGWKNIPHYQYNKTGTKRKDLSSETYQQIAEWNQEDMDLYEAVKRMRQE